MRKYQNFALLLCSLFFSLYSFAQQPLNQINILSFSVKNKMPAEISAWGTTPGGLILTAQRIPQSAIQGVKLVVQIKQGGTKIYGNPVDASPMLDFNAVKTFTGSELSGYISNGNTLKPGNYSVCVQFFNLDRYPISKEMCKEFVVEDAVQVQQNYSPPQNISPGNAKVFIPEELKGAVTFRWTPVIPKPKETVSYRLKVWQLMQGQNGAQAMRSNDPIVEKEVINITQAVVTNLYTGPCKPPYLCEYVWNVQAFTREGKPLGTSEGKSEAWSFKVKNNIDIQIDSVKFGCCIDGKQSIYIKVKNNLASAVNIVAIKYKINGVGASITLSPIAPPLVQNIAGNATKVFTSSINCINTANFLKFLVDAEDVADPDNKETEVVNATLNCKCDACDEKNFTLTAPSPSQINFTNNTLSFTQSLNIVTNPVKLIKSITAELVYFEMIPENNMCIPCNKDAATYGHFVNGTNSMEWNTVQQPKIFNITTPQLTPCCSAVFKWCIRYKIEFKDCTTCNKLVCYEKKKEGCDKVTDTKK
ncbi:MAG: hypothetical protein LH615_10820 [Ferruginibacter sp.]|nr:hypothetical protein [Ferruginibacter sp.]